MLDLHWVGASLATLCAAGVAVGLVMALSAWVVDRTRQASWRRG